MKTVLITGSQGFIGSYLCSDFLKAGYRVLGIDNYSKYGKVSRPHDDHESFVFFEMDILDIELDNLPDVFLEIDYIVAVAAMIGGITYFHKYAYDLLANNERILASTFDLAIKLHKEQFLERIVVLSSSMVFERTEVYPTPEAEVENCPPPMSTYGFQKLSCEYFCKGAYEQYKLPYTIIRPFNCVGIGEEDSITEHQVTSGNIKMMMSHVLPDIINKISKGQDPLHILGDGDQIRCYTNGLDIARGIRLAMESSNAINEDFNISTPIGTSVLELAKIVWSKLNPDKEFSFVSDEPYKYDVQKRIPDVSKATNLFTFEAKISLEDSIDEVINWLRTKGNNNET
jgi:UDP-glucose 4-epimerase